MLGSCHICILVYSISDLGSFVAIDEYHDKVIQNEATPIYFLVALDTNDSKEPLVTQQDGQSLCDQKKFDHFIQVSLSLDDN